MSPSPNELQTNGCIAAFRSLKGGKNLFMLLLLLGLVGTVSSFIAVEFLEVIDPLYAPRPTTQTAPSEEAVSKTADKLFSASDWEKVLRWGTTASQFLAFVSAILAVLGFMFAVKLAIVGRLGGIAGFMSAFLWSLVLLVIVTPWQHILTAMYVSGGEYNIFGATYSLQDIIRAKTTRVLWDASGVPLSDLIVYYARFLAYPGVALLVWLVVMVKFARGYKTNAMTPVGTIRNERPETPPEPLV